MTVAEFIEYLKMQPQDAEVQVLCRVPGREYAGDTTEWRTFNPDLHVYLIDLTDNQFVKDPEERKWKCIQIGED